MQTYTTPTGNGPTTTGGATDQAKEKAQEAAGAAKEQAQQAAGQAKGALSTQIDQRSTQAGEKVTGMASDVRSVGEQLREQGKEQPAKIAEQAAERAERVGNYLTQSDADRILGDVEDFGRRQPWAVIGGGLALGLVASRFLKASSSRRYEQRRESYQSYRSLPARTPDVTPTPTTSGIHTPPVSSGPAVPTTPPADTTLTGGMPAGSPGATAPGSSDFEGNR